ncbi:MULTISPECIES: Rpn family recombination-promoting nuclease/putative transposase [unclassified Fibrobacter]|uniref:Rpn family recombination-promoting nuclease/putative transposase n=1 Tax=unclassified Fibrobacter TaxID=2634177 RepID=UPI000D6BE6EB|nr:MULTISPECIES: Rpn family recombination-promoting nuclease/putative transposase [unclassified Fibrobacter]PWJ59771.1 putative YhgA-like transposase [Fibrobacter sp. UWR4]PZW68037.1 putative YhgA-like transposase [Fibrobacter sp. UWR1]
MNKRKHDGFLKYTYSKPVNAKALLQIASRTNKNLAAILAEVDLETLEEIPEAFNEVGERGEADLAFKVKAINGGEIRFGLLLEHKSSPDNGIMAQIGKYAIRVMVDKNNSEYAWMPTKAIVIYNGTDPWDPLAQYKNIHAMYNGRIPHFEFAFVNLAEIDDDYCLAHGNAEAAIGAITMKYAFDMEKYNAMLPKIEKKLATLPNSESACLVSKIELYLGEYISQEALEDLKMAFKSIGQRLGFVSAGDERRALERSNRRLKSANKAKDAVIADKDAMIADKDAQLADSARRIAELEAKLAEMGK